VQVAVADCGGLAEPRIIDDPDGERGRGLLLVQRLSLRTGWAGDRRGRLVWAQVAWPDQAPAVSDPSKDPYQAVVREGEAALARRFAGVPAWFGRSTLAWWAVAGPAGLVSAPTAQELAGLLYRLLNAPGLAQSPVSGQARDSNPGENFARCLRRQHDAEGRDVRQRRRPRAASPDPDRGGDRHPVRIRRPVAAPNPVAAGAA
jgi:hypothetical protein